ncbi:MAG: hypothetical protein Q7S52_02820 [bacterium]|nr:hypothetical protein [bacterium]
MNITIRKQELERLIDFSVKKYITEMRDPDNGLELSGDVLRRLKKYEDTSQQKGISLAKLRKKYG